METHLLNDEDIQKFLINGYLVIQPKIPAETHKAIFDASNTLFKEHGDPGNNIYPSVRGLDQIYKSPEVHGALESLLGKNYMLHAHRRAHEALPGRKTQHWHKDTYKGRQYRCLHRPWWLMAMYYPQDTTLQMGPTALLPGTQYFRGDYKEPGDVKNKKTRSVHSHWCTSEVALNCKAGTVVIIHYDIWHRANTNKTKNQVRWMFKFQFFRTEAPSSTPSWNHSGSDIWCPENQSNFGDTFDWMKGLRPFQKVPKPPVLEELPEHEKKIISDAVDSVDSELLIQGVKDNDYDLRNASHSNRLVGYLLKSAMKPINTDNLTCIKELKQALKSKCQSIINDGALKAFKDQFIRDRATILKAMWCWMLGKRGPAVPIQEDISGLSSKLNSANENERLYASCTLGSMESEEAHASLLASLKTTSTKYRRTTLYGLALACSLDDGNGSISSISEKTLNNMLSFITEHECFVPSDDKTRFCASPCTEDDFDHELSKVRGTPSEGLFCALLACTLVSPSTLPMDACEKCAHMFLQVAAGNHTLSIRTVAVEGLGYFGGSILEESFGFLESLLSSQPDDTLRTCACYSILQLCENGERVLKLVEKSEAIMNALNDKNRYTAAYAFEILLKTNNDHVIKKVLNLVSEKFKLPTECTDTQKLSWERWCPITSTQSPW